VWKDISMGLGLGLLLVGCGAEERPPTAAREVAAPTVEAPNPAIARYLTEIKSKQRCNRLMGCKPGLALVQQGRDAVPAVLAALAEQPLDGRYWQIRLITLLGQLGDVRAVEPLHGALDQSRWELRARSAMALAQIADSRSLVPLRSLLTRGHDLASDGAALYALHALGVEVDGRPARQVLVDRLPDEQAALAALNPGHFAFLAELVGAAQLRERLQLARWGALHRDRFTRMASLQTLAQLRDTPGIPYAMTRLDDESPGVRRQALRTLRLITGRKAFTEPEHWRDWCEQRSCLEPIRGQVPPGATGP